MTAGLGQHNWKEILLSEMERRVEGPYCVGWQVGGVCFGVWEVLRQFKAIVLLTDYEILELEGVCGVCGEHT